MYSICKNVALGKTKLNLPKILNCSILIKKIVLIRHDDVALKNQFNNFYARITLIR